MSQEHLLAIKKEIASSYTDFQSRATAAWGEIIEELAKFADAIDSSGSDVRSLLLTGISTNLNQFIVHTPSQFLRAVQPHAGSVGRY